jgi:hypothetical protein
MCVAAAWHMERGHISITRQQTNNVPQSTAKVSHAQTSDKQNFSCLLTAAAPSAHTEM